MKIHSSCEIEDFVETHLCKLCVILRSRALRVVCIGRRLPLQLQCSYQGQQGDFSHCNTWLDCFCTYFLQAFLVNTECILLKLIYYIRLKHGRRPTFDYCSSLVKPKLEKTCLRQGASSRAPWGRLGRGLLTSWVGAGVEDSPRSPVH